MRTAPRTMENQTSLEKNTAGHARRHLTGAATLFAIIALSVSPACKDGKDAKKSGGPVTVAALTGDVSVLRGADKPRPLKHRETLKMGDTVIVGVKSFAAIMYGPDMLLKLSPNTKMKISAVGTENEVYLDQGKLFSKVNKLKKGENFKVRTKTSVAAVRGTEFLVNHSGPGGTYVSVGDGKVAVAAADRTGKEAEEKIVDAGKIAVVEKNVTVRPVTIDEKKEIVAFADVRVKEDQGKIENLDKVYKDVSLPPDIKIEDQGVMNTRPNAFAAKRSYAANEPITVVYSNLPDGRYVWISLDKKGSPPGSQETYDWTYGYKQGTMKFPSGLPKGEYEVRVHFSRGNAVNASSSFVVQ